MASNAVQATVTAALAMARQLCQATRAAPNPTICPTPKCSSPDSQRSAFEAFQNMTAALTFQTGCR